MSMAHNEQAESAAQRPCIVDAGRPAQSAGPTVGGIIVIVVVLVAAVALAGIGYQAAAAAELVAGAGIAGAEIVRRLTFAAPPDPRS